MRLPRRDALVIGLGLGAGALAGCSSDRSPDSELPAQPTPSTNDSTSPASSPSPTPSRTPAPTAGTTPTAAPTEQLPKVRNSRSLPALMRQDFSGRAPQRRNLLSRTADYSKYAVRYRSGDLTISGILWLPRSGGRHPAVILNHGYINPATYFSGQGMPREQEYLARRGVVVLHTDYRGHAQSSPAGALDRELRLGYTTDVINAVQAVKRLPQVDPDRVAMFGRSMGGGITYNALVTAPTVVRAALAWAPVSSSFTDNYNRWTAPERSSVSDELIDRYGRPDDDKPFYADLSARNFFDRIAVPVRIEHGTSDSTCPIRWSERTVELMKAADVDVTFSKRRGEEHTFGTQWPAAMRASFAFLRTHLDF